MTQVFVYGTLLKGESNHDLLRRGKFLGATKTQPEFTMIDLGAFPAIFEQGKTAVAGEVYEVDLATVAKLDRLEGVPDLYTRKSVELQDGSEAEIYVMSRRSGVRDYPAIHSGDWKQCQQERW